MIIADVGICRSWLVIGREYVFVEFSCFLEIRPLGIILDFGTKQIFDVFEEFIFLSIIL